jgi:hypothetical protein
MRSRRRRSAIVRLPLGALHDGTDLDTESGDELVVLRRRDYDAPLARCGGKDLRIE